MRRMDGAARAERGMEAAGDAEADEAGEVTAGGGQDET